MVVNNATLNDGCPPPFYNAAQFTSGLGSAEQRVCLPAGTGGLPKTLNCCLPCPVTNFIFPEKRYTNIADAAAWLNVLGVVLLVLLLLSYAVLPASYTRSHYLNTCLLVSSTLISLAFVVPKAAHSEACADPVTPNDMYSSTSCAFSGAFTLAGAITCSTWVLVRAFSMHLQICWDISPGRRFFYWVQLLGWSFSAAIFTAAITSSGVAFRFGPGACHILKTHSVASFWGWLLVVAGLAITIQLATIGYCFHVYVRNAIADEGDLQTQATEEAAPTFSSSQPVQTARTIYNRLKRVLWLQWRGLAVVAVTLFDVLFFAVFFVYIDNKSGNEAAATPWIECLLMHSDNIELCHAAGQKFQVALPTIGALLIIESLIGLIFFLLMFRWSIITGWIEFAKHLLGDRNPEFESLGSKQQNKEQTESGSESQEQYHGDPQMYEMQEPTKEYHVDVDRATASPSMSAVTTPVEKYNTAMQYSYASRSPDPNVQGYFNNGVPVPMVPGQAYAHATMPNGTPQYAYAPQTYYQQGAPAGYAYPPYPVQLVYDAQGNPTHYIADTAAIQQAHAAALQHHQAGGYSPTQTQNYHPEYAHHNFQPQPSELQQPHNGSNAGTEVNHDEPQTFHAQ